MAKSSEPTLSVSWTDLQSYVATFAGWDRTAANWETYQTNDFVLIVKAGLRKFYYPPAISPDTLPYEWEFLRPTAQITLATDTAEYDLPDDFGGVVLPESVCFYTTPTQPERRLRKVRVDEITALLGKNLQSGTPQYWATRPKAYDAINGHQYEMVLWPRPAAADNNDKLNYRYIVVPDTIDSTNVYPIGGGAHSETIIEAVLAAAEEYLDDDGGGVHHARFLELLGSSIRLDKETKSQNE